MICEFSELLYSIKKKLTFLSGQGKSNSLTSPKSSPVAMALPPCDTSAQFTSAFCEFLGQMPTTSLPITL